MSKNSMHRALPIFAVLVLLTTGEARSNSTCDRPAGSNLICNAFFEDAAGLDHSMPAGWNFSPGWEPPTGAVSTAFLSSQSSSGGDSRLTLIKGVEPLLLDSEVHVPIETGRAYRLKMKYRMDAVGEDPRGRITVESHYLDEDRNPIHYTACSHNERIVAL